MLRLVVLGLLMVSTSVANAWPSSYESSSVRSRLKLRPRLFARVEVEKLRVRSVERVERIIVEERVAAPLVQKEIIRERIVQPEIRKEVIVQPEIREQIREKVEVCPSCPQEFRFRSKLRHW